MRRLSDEQRAIRDATRDFVRKEIAPFAAEWDRTATVPLDTVRKAGALGLFGVSQGAAFVGIRVATMNSDGNLYLLHHPVARLLVDLLDVGVAFRFQQNPELRWILPGIENQRIDHRATSLRRADKEAPPERIVLVML